MGSFLGVYFGALGTGLMAINLDHQGNVCWDQQWIVVKCIVMYPLMAIETIFCVGRS